MSVPHSAVVPVVSSVSFVTPPRSVMSFFFFNDTATTEIYTLSLHDALPISHRCRRGHARATGFAAPVPRHAVCDRSEEHTSELQSLAYLVCRLLLEKKKTHRVHPELAY